MVQQGARLSLLAEAPKARRPAVMGATALFKFVKIQYIYRPMPSPSHTSHYLYIHCYYLTGFCSRAGHGYLLVYLISYTNW